MITLEARVTERIEAEFHIPKAMTEARSKLYRGDKLTRKEVENFLGEGTYQAYKFAHEHAKGLRRYCDNAEDSHWVESAERARNLGFDNVYVISELNHDVVEDISKDIEEAYYKIEEIRSNFGDDVARNVAIVTNRYSIMIECIEKLTEGTPATGYSRKILLDTLESIEKRVADSPIEERFTNKFKGLKEIINGLNIDEVNRKIEKDKRYSIFEEMKLKTYELFIADIFGNAIERYERREERYDAGIIIKALDDIDNLRTVADPHQLPLMERTLGKIDTFLEYAEKFNDYLVSKGKENEGFLTVYGALKDQLIEQLVRRRFAIEFYNDTRFTHARARIDEKIAYYSKRFNIDTKSVIERVVSQLGGDEGIPSFVAKSLRVLINA